MSFAPRCIEYPAPGGRRLSLAMIVKNEAATLERTLRAARPHVDEIVVVDTGSTDGTRAIAQRYADVFDEIVWPDSFSLARNYSMDLATGEWILILDGDEYIEDPADWARLLAALDAPGAAAVALPVRNLLPEGNVLAADVTWQERIFRRHPLIRYAGRVHNQITEGLQAYMRKTMRTVHFAEAPVVHTGYALDPDGLVRKYTPRLALLRSEYEQPRSDTYRAYYGYQYGVALYLTRQFEAADRIFGELDYDLMTPQNAFYTRTLAAQTAIHLSDPERALASVDAMLKIDPKESISYFLAGYALLRARRISDGLLMLMEAFRVNARCATSIRFELNPAVIFTLLRLICERAGMHDYATAFGHFEHAGEPNPARVEALMSRFQEQLVLSQAA